jgi:hypothetical protein
MKEWRMTLDGLPEAERVRFLLTILGRFNSALQREFPRASGYEYEGAWDADDLGRRGFIHDASFRVSRGRFWGLQVRVLSRGSPPESAMVAIDTYYPCWKNFMSPIRRLEDLLNGMPFLGHLAFLLILPLMVLLPFIALFRLAVLWPRPHAGLAGRQLENAWAEVKDSCPGEVSLARLVPIPVVYFLALILAVAATAGCFWWAGLGSIGESWSIAMDVAGSIFGLLSFSLLVALIMTLLGLDVQPRPGGRIARLLGR